MRGLYAVTPDIEDTSLLESRVAAVLEGGARILQYRNKVADTALRRAQASTLNALCRQHGCRLIVNDHIDLAAEIDAAGVHIGMDDASVAEARSTLGPAKVIGVSCYGSLERARRAQREGADYVAFGSFFPSSVKPNAVRASPDLLRAARVDLAVPIVAIGGITLENAALLLDAGADAVAVISALFSAPDVTIAARTFVQLYERAHVAER